MTVSQAYKDLLGDGIWGSSAGAQVMLPEEAGLDREDGWPVAYEQFGTGKHPEREVWNGLLMEAVAALADIASQGILSWDAEVDYAVSDDAVPFVTTVTGVHVGLVPSGPSTGNPTDPDTPGQEVWRRF